MINNEKLELKGGVASLSWGFSFENLNPRSMSGTRLRAEWFVPLLIIRISVVSLCSLLKSGNISRPKNSIFFPVNGGVIKQRNDTQPLWTMPKTETINLIPQIPSMNGGYLCFSIYHTFPCDLMQQFLL